MGLFLSVFLIVLAINIIETSRRRYGFLFSGAFVLSWVLSPNVLVFNIAISLATSAIYSLLKKPMSFLFIVQFYTPILIVLVSMLSTISILLSIGILVLVMIIFTTLISVQYYEKTINISKWIDKHIKKISSFFSLLILVMGIIFLALNKEIRDDLGDVNISWHTNSSNVVLTIFQWTTYSLLIIGILIYLYHQKNKNKLLSRSGYFYLIIIVIIFTNYNPFFYCILHKANLNYLFEYVQLPLYYSIFIPIFIYARNMIKKF